MNFDFENRIIRLNNSKPLQLRRDEDRTIRDIDIVDLSTDEKARRNFEAFRKKLKADAEAESLPHPHVGVEGTFYPGGKKRHGRLQFVTSFEEDEVFQQHLVFDDVSEAVDARSLESWRVLLDDGTSFTMFNPLAHLLNYYMRVPSGLKPKDQKGNKIQIMEMIVDKFVLAAIERGVDYIEIHQGWFDYLDHFLKDQKALTRLKALGTRAYWSSIGTATAHGRGPFSRLSSATTVFKG